LPAAEQDEIAGYLEVIAAYYQSPAFLRAQPGGGTPFAPELSARAEQAVTHSIYLQDLLGRLPIERRRAIAATQHGKFLGAVRALAPLARRAPGDAKLQSDLAAAFLLAGRPAEAARTLAAARAAAPDDLVWREPVADLDGAAAR
jgi:predicted Zn-dependent protease